jgi:diacylglycerol diphosphate phosphatase/phosphatidate phosphatase
MNLFRRHQREGVAAESSAHQHERKETLIMNMSTRPTFSQWLKVTWLDIVTMAVMGIIGLGVSL